METTSNFVCEDYLQTKYDTLESPHSKGAGTDPLN